MKHILSIMIIMLMMGLVACTGADSNDSDNDDTDTGNTQQTTTPEVTFTVIGATEVNGEGSINLFCDDGDGIAPSSFIEIGYLDGREQLNLNLLTGSSGTVALIGSDDPQAQPGQASYIYYRSEDGTNYNSGTGELVIETMPAAEGDMLVATLSAELSDDDGNSITLTATYNADAGMQSFDDCNAE